MLLELVWVLEFRDICATQIASGLNELLGLPNLKPECVEASQRALRSCKDGTGFAAALHLALSEGRQKFMNFDKVLVKQSQKLELKPEVMLA